MIHLASNKQHFLARWCKCLMSTPLFHESRLPYSDQFLGALESNISFFTFSISLLFAFCTRHLVCQLYLAKEKKKFSWSPLEDSIHDEKMYFLTLCLFELPVNQTICWPTHSFCHRGPKAWVCSPGVSEKTASSAVTNTIENWISKIKPSKKQIVCHNIVTFRQVGQMNSSWPQSEPEKCVSKCMQKTCMWFLLPIKQRLDLHSGKQHELFIE